MNPGRISDVVTELSPRLTVDDALDAGAMAGTGRTMTDIRSDDVDRVTRPTNGVGRRGDRRSSGPTNRRSRPSVQC